MKDNTKNRLFKLFTSLIALAALFQVGGFLIWLVAYIQETEFSIYSELGPLLIQCIYLIAPLVMIIFIRSGKKVGKSLFLMALLSSIFLPYLTIVQHLANDPIAAGFLGLFISLPLSVGLAILTFIELIKSI